MASKVKSKFMLNTWIKLLTIQRRGSRSEYHTFPLKRMANCCLETTAAIFVGIAATQTSSDIWTHATAKRTVENDNKRRPVTDPSSHTFRK